MDLIQKNDIDQNEQQNVNATNLNDISHYTIKIKHKYVPFFGKLYKCYRHEVSSETGHIILYLIDSSIIAIPIQKRSWVVYSNYWKFVKHLEEVKNVRIRGAGGEV